MNAKLSQARFLHRQENGKIKWIQTIPHNPYVSLKSTLKGTLNKFILIHCKGNLKLLRKLWGIISMLLMSPFLWQCQNPRWLSLAFMINFKWLQTWPKHAKIHRTDCCNWGIYLVSIDVFFRKRSQVTQNVNVKHNRFGAKIFICFHFWYSPNSSNKNMSSL